MQQLGYQIRNNRRGKDADASGTDLVNMKRPIKRHNHDVTGKKELGDRREYLDSWTARSSFLHVPGYVNGIAVMKIQDPVVPGRRP
jgi:hypothetical protein